MSITLENLKTYNKTVQARKDDEPVPPPVLLLDKYRVRLLPLADLPIISQYSNLPQLGFNSDEVVVIDSPIISEEEKSTKLEPRVAPVVKEDEDEDREQMEFEDEDKENAGINGPLETSFLTLEKLEKRNGNGMEVDISGFDITLANFDTNPIPHADGVSLQKFLRLHAAENFADTIVKLPIWISTFSTNFPYVCWLAAGKTQKDQKFGAATRVLGYFDENSEKLVNQLNAACGGSQLNRYRAVYDEIRKIASEKRQNPGEVVLDMRWNTKNNVALLENPVNAAECTIKIDLGWQDKRFFVDESIFEQLFFVINLADVLGNPEHEVFFPHGKGKFDELVKEMNALVEACSDENKVFATLNDGSEEITHNVWNIVRRCGDVKQATLLFKNFLQALTYGKIKSRVQENNKSHLATLIRASKTCDFRMPILERLSTIEMMMEIGVENLRSRVVKKFTETLKFPSEELNMVLKTCENDLRNCNCNTNASTISLLPITMALATVSQIFYLLNEKDLVILPDLTRRVLAKFTSGMVEKAKKAETLLEYTFETTLPVLRINKEAFMSRRPRIWTCENVKTTGANVQTRMMTVLELESSSKHVTNAVNAIRPVRDVEEEKEEQKTEGKAEKKLKQNADYTVSHTVISYFPKL